jgi:2-phospho-L-lactate/phosphoenolpyruvate guanylyltransferase
MRFDARGLWAIVPVKRFSAAKQRLRSVLSGDERAQLAEAMLRDVLLALSPLPHLGGIAVVTADTAAVEIGRSFGARIVSDRLEAGVNMAVRQGLQAVGAHNASVAIIAADVPFATSDDIAEALTGLEQCSIVIARATIDGGTNLLAMRNGHLIEPTFGEQSFARHRELARAAKLSCGVCQIPRLGHDIDRLGDLTVPANAGATQTAALFERIKIADRLNRHALTVTE